MSTATIPRFDPDKFREALRRSGLTQGALARSICGSGNRSEHNTRTHLRWYVQRRRTPTLETILKLARALGCDVKDLCVEVEL